MAMVHPLLLPWLYHYINAPCKYRRFTSRVWLSSEGKHLILAMFHYIPIGPWYPLILTIVYPSEFPQRGPLSIAALSGGCGASLPSGRRGRAPLSGHGARHCWARADTGDDARTMKDRDFYGGFMEWGYPKWMVYFMEKSQTKMIKWMRTGGSPMTLETSIQPSLLGIWGYNGELMGYNMTKGGGIR